MRISYVLCFTALCPNNPEIVDNYTINIKSKKMIMAEKLVKYFKSFNDVEIFQEELTKRIAKKFIGCKIKIIATHLGVEIKSVERFS